MSLNYRTRTKKNKIKNIHWSNISRNNKEDNRKKYEKKLRLWEVNCPNIWGQRKGLTDGAVSDKKRRGEGTNTKKIQGKVLNNGKLLGLQLKSS